MDTILVTGATGHIGNVLVRQLLARGKRVRALLFPGEDPKPLQGLEVEIVEGDVLDCTALRRAMHGVARVFHLAGIISIMPGAQTWMRRVNVEGTQNVLSACREEGVERLVYTSSIHAIPPPAGEAPIDERIPFDPTKTWGKYDQSKAMASLAVQKAAAEGLDAVIVCPTGVIGPYDFRGSEMGEFLLDLAHPTPHVYIDGAYDFVDVRDVALGHILASEKGRRGEAYILAGARVTVRQIIEMVESFTGLRTAKLRVPVWLAQAAAAVTPLYYRTTRRKPKFTPYSIHTVTSNSVISPAKARRELGFSARPLAESVADTLNWMRRNQRLALAAQPVDRR